MDISYNEIVCEGICQMRKPVRGLPGRLYLTEQSLYHAGDLFLFVVFKRDDWLEDIHRLLKGNEHQNTKSIGRQDDYGKGF